MEPGSEMLLDIQGLSLSLGGRPILRDLSFGLGKGQFHYLTGRTGAGKTSLLRLIYRDLRPDSGSIRAAGLEVHRLSDAQVPQLRRRLGLVFQEVQLIREQTVAQNLHTALRATGWKDSSRIKQRVSEVLIRAGISGKAGLLPQQLSGGEQQRVAVARALLHEPALLLADEPTGNLDPESARQLMELLLTINRAGTAILMATHDYHILMDFPAPVLELHQSALRRFPTPLEFLETL
ncbi:MAG: ATP-binding cassette domain-containing protein [Bacteroidia bacterium]|nr:ATP-binding cassette domain-containing protein [Bacteroidia bacterium]